MTFIAGPFNATWAGQALSTIEDGFDLEVVYAGEPIKGDNLGDSTQDGVYRGGDCFVNFVMEHAQILEVMQIVWPFYVSDPGVEGILGDIGTLWSAAAETLILTPIVGTTAATVGPTYTFTKAIIAPDFPIRQLLAARLRKVPVRLQILPTGTPTAWFTITGGSGE